MIIFITGGAGYIGTELVYRLSTDKSVDKIIVYDNLSRGNHNMFIGQRKLHKRIEFIAGDLLDSHKLNRAVKNADIIYHLAARVTTPFNSVDGHFYEQVNDWGTASLVEAVDASAAGKLVYTSSLAVYGHSDSAFSENAVPQPIHHYGISKWKGERHVQRLNSKMNTLILRLGNVYGYSKSMRFDAVINKFMFEAHYNKKININGSGEQRRSFIHIQQLVYALAALVHSDVPGGTYNLSGNDLSINEISEMIRKVYPAVEELYYNQDYPQYNAVMQPSAFSLQYLPLPKSDLFRELVEFSHEFTFGLEELDYCI